MVGEYGSYEKYAVLSLSDLFCRLLIWFGFFFFSGGLESDALEIDTGGWDS